MATLFDLVSDPNARLRYAAVIKTWDPSIPGEVTHHFSDDGLNTLPSETPANVYFPPRIQRALRFARSMFDGATIGGRSVPDFGALVLTNADGALDELLLHEFEGRQIDIYVGGDGFRFTDYFKVFCGTAASFAFDETEISIDLRSFAFLLDRAAHQAIYPDTAAADIVGKPIPECYGEVKNITPVLIAPATDEYQVHNGQIEQITTVYDAGVDITVNVTANLALGTFTISPSPTGQVTCDVKGSKEGGVYVSTAADIVKRIAGNKGITLFDNASFIALNSAAPYTVGHYFESGENALEIIDYFINSVGGFWGFNRDGAMTVGQVIEPASSVSVLGENLIRNPNAEGTGLDDTPPPPLTSITRSLAFPLPAVNGHLKRTPVGDGDRRTLTFATWVERDVIQPLEGSGDQHILHIDDSGPPDYNNAQITFWRDKNDPSLDQTIRVEMEGPGGSEEHDIHTVKQFTTPDVYFHLTVIIDTTHATSSERIRIYVNGDRLPVLALADGMPAQNFQGAFNRGDREHIIGRREFNVHHLEAKLADTYLVDGAAVEPDNFVNFDGLFFSPRAYDGPLGTHGFHLTYEDAADLGKDAGGSNHWTLVNLGADNQSSDVPTSPLVTP